MNYRIFNSIPGLYLPETSSTVLHPKCDNKTSKCLLEGGGRKTAPANNLKNMDPERKIKT